MSEKFSAKDWKIVIAVAGISLIQGLQYGVSPVLSEISHHFSNVSVNLIQMLITAPSIFAIFVALASGWLVTRVSKKRLLIFAAIISALTGLAPYLYDSFGLLFVTRIIYGLALGIATALNSAVVSEFFPDGPKRVKAMGIQGASVGLGMVIVTSISGVLGSYGFEKSYLINILGFVSLLLIIVCLPETGVIRATKLEPIHLNRHVFLAAIFAFLEFFFLIAFTTNISMLIAENFEEGAELSGIITGIFSGAQIIIGLVLGSVARKTKKMTLSVAMFLFALGCLFLILFSKSFFMLVTGAVFCGLSQGMFIPTIYVEAVGAVNNNSAPMASAVITCATCSGQLVSATALNGISSVVFGTVTPTNIYIIAMVGMIISGIICGAWQKGTMQNQ